MTNSLWSQQSKVNGIVPKCGNIWQPYVAILRVVQEEEDAEHTYSSPDSRMDMEQ